MASSITFTPVTMGPSVVEGTSAGKKRTPKTKAIKDDIVYGYGATASASQELQGATGNPTEISGPVTQSFPAETLEAAPTHAHPAAQEQTQEGQALGPPQPQQRAEVAPTEGFLPPEAPSAERKHEAKLDTLHASDRAYQQSTAGRESPEAAHGPEPA